MAEKTIKLSPPGPDAPGFLLRQRDALRMQHALQNNDPEAAGKLVAFLLPFVVEPEDRTEAEEVLWNLSQNQFTEAVSAIKGESETPLESGGS